MFDQNRDLIYENEVGVLFPEALYAQINQAADGCPEHAIVLTRVEEQLATNITYAERSIKGAWYYRSMTV
jgi:hypothetical protein